MVLVEIKHLKETINRQPERFIQTYFLKVFALIVAMVHDSLRVDVSSEGQHRSDQHVQTDADRLAEY